MDFNVHHSQTVMQPPNITGGHIIFMNGVQPAALEEQRINHVLATLTAAAVVRATHDSVEIIQSKKCHEGTRTQVLARLNDRVRFPSNEFMVWMHGAAGVGKSAVMYSLCRTLQESKLLLGSFFFFRQDPSRNQASGLIPTLAYQLLVAMPVLQSYMADQMQSDPNLFRRSLSTQAESLLLKPLLAAKQNDQLPEQCPRAIIVDGLDECAEQEQRSVIQCLHDVASRSPIPIIVMIASRKEHTIRTVFEAAPFSQDTEVDDLNLDKDVDQDIRTFLIDSFKRIRQEHVQGKRLGEQWPGMDVINELVKRASGQFVYVVTVIRFVEMKLKNPKTQLETIMQRRPLVGKASPFRELDSLYQTIFNTIEDDDRATVLMILGLLFFARGDEVFKRPYNFVNASLGVVQAYEQPNLIEKLLKLEEGDCERLLLPLQSLIGFGGQNAPLQIHHKSLRDFLSDENRSGEFYIDEAKIQAEMVILYIKSDFWHPHPFLSRVSVGTFLYNLERACPSPKLREHISSINFIEMEKRVKLLDFDNGLHPGYTWFSICEQFIRDFEHSKFEDKDELLKSLLSSFTQVAKRRLLPYSNPQHPEMWCLLYMACNVPPYSLEMGLQKTIVDSISSELAENEREEGLLLIRLGSVHGQFKSRYGAPVICQACPEGGPLKDIIYEVFPDMDHPAEGSYLEIFLEKFMRRVLSTLPSNPFFLSSKLFRIVLPECELSVGVSKAWERLLEVYGDHPDFPETSKLCIERYIMRVREATPDYDTIEGALPSLPKPVEPEVAKDDSNPEEPDHDKPEAGRNAESDTAPDSGDRPLVPREGAIAAVAPSPLFTSLTLRSYAEAVYRLIIAFLSYIIGR